MKGMQVKKISWIVSFCKLLVALIESVHSKEIVEKPHFCWMGPPGAALKNTPGDSKNTPGRFRLILRKIKNIVRVQKHKFDTPEDWKKQEIIPKRFRIVKKHFCWMVPPPLEQRWKYLICASNWCRQERKIPFYLHIYMKIKYMGSTNMD